MSIVIHDCPFCGHVDVEISEVSIGEYAIECNECRCIGPIHGDLMGTIAAWNNAIRLADITPEINHDL